MDFDKIETILGVKFDNKELLTTAFTHRSYLNETKMREMLANGEAVEHIITACGRPDALLESPPFLSI